MHPLENRDRFSSGLQQATRHQGPAKCDGVTLTSCIFSVKGNQNGNNMNSFPCVILLAFNVYIHVQDYVNLYVYCTIYIQSEHTQTLQLCVFAVFQPPETKG